MGSKVVRREGLG